MVALLWGHIGHPAFLSSISVGSSRSQWGSVDQNFWGGLDPRHSTASGC